MNEPLFGIVVFVANLVTPTVGVICGYVAQSVYRRRLEAMPMKVAAGMPKRFPMADLMICLFMLGPILGVVNVAATPPGWAGSPPTGVIVLWWITLTILFGVNLCGPRLIRMGMPPDGTFKLEGDAPAEVQFVGKPVVSHSALYDVREI